MSVLGYFVLAKSFIFRIRLDIFENLGKFVIILTQLG